MKPLLAFGLGFMMCFLIIALYLLLQLIPITRELLELLKSEFKDE